MKNKYLDFTLSETDEEKIIFRFDIKRSSTHLFDSGLAKRPEDRTFQDVYKIYYNWKIVLEEKENSTTPNEYLESTEIFKFPWDENSALSDIGENTKEAIKKKSSVLDIKSFGQPSSEWNIQYIDECSYEDCFGVCVHQPARLEYQVWNNVNNLGYRFVLEEKKAKEFAEYIDSINHYMLRHAVPI
jgi:hypothetical protein